MSDDMELRKLIHAWGENERDAEELAQFSTEGGLWQRFWRWLGRIAKREREELIKERDDAQ